MDPQAPQPVLKMVDRNGIGVGVFSNTVNVSVTPGEIFLDFGLIAPDTSIMGTAPGEATLVSRVVLTKDHAKGLSDVLERTLNA